MENTPITFVQGMNFRQVPPTAPEAVRGNISFKVNEMIEFLNKYDNKGWVNIKMMKSKEKGSIYFILDEYKPKTDPAAAQEYNDQKYRTQPLNEKQQNEVSIGDKLFGNGLSDEDLKAMESMPF